MDYFLSRTELDSYLEDLAKDVSKDVVRIQKTHLNVFYNFLQEDKKVTKENLEDFRSFLRSSDYSATTITNYSKSVNKFLRAKGLEELCYRKGAPKDITGKRFGRLVAIEPTEERKRNNVLWKCKCDCGKETLVSVAALQSGNTTSCGCIGKEQLSNVNMYIDGTSLRTALGSDVADKRSVSGYKGVSRRGDKWRATLMYKGVRYDLGTYVNLEDAVKARQEGRERVMADVQFLKEQYEKHKA